MACEERMKKRRRKGESQSMNERPWVEVQERREPEKMMKSVG